MKILDANFILRMIIADNLEMAEQAADVIDNNSVLLLPEVVAEVVFVMTKFYKKDRISTALALIGLLELDTVNTNCGNVLLKGLELYKNTSLDFVDCLLCAYHTEKNYGICTFDKKLLKLMQREDEMKKGE